MSLKQFEHNLTLNAPRADLLSADFSHGAASFQIAQADEHTGETHAEKAAPESASHAAAPHAEKPEAYQLPDDLPNIYTLTEKLVSKETHAEGKESALRGPFAVEGPPWVNPAFAMFYAFIFVVIIRRILRGASIEKPSRPQVAIEAIFGGLYDFFKEILGGEANARKYVPYIGSLWFFIYLCNVCGVIPLLKSPTAHFWTTVGLGICTFCYVNYNAIKAGGLGHYLWHHCGSPEDALGWGFAILIFPLEAVGTLLVKPLSLSLRLSGNIFGEDKLLAAFMGLGVLIVSLIFRTPAPLFGVPLHLPFLFLAMLTCVIQATVFSLLASVYIAMLLPHDEHEHGEDHGHHEEAKAH